MVVIGLISDTHGFLDPKVFNFFNDCDEIWHAGDFGTKELMEDLQKFKKLRAVYGNIDGNEIRLSYPKDLKFELEGFRIFMTHIGGYPGRYAPGIKKELMEFKPHIFICGHSHILRIGPDKEMNNMLYINPGAAGKEGFHKVRTLVKFELKNQKVKNMKVIELGKRGHIKSDEY
jgi:putative phosphoesterase